MSKTFYLSKDMLSLIKEEELRKDLATFAQAFHQFRQKSATGKQSFRIGVMGKSGAGKSTLINSLCQEYSCETGGSGGVTREIQEIKGKLGEMSVILIDFPGIAENQKWNEAYLNIYKQHLESLDLILWTIKVDDRAIVEDEQFYNEHIYYEGDIARKFIFILSQADKAEPTREWDNYSFSPSSSQLENIKRNHNRITMDFNTQYNKVIPIASNYVKNESTIKTYNFDAIFESILFKLNSLSDVSNEVSSSTTWRVTQREADKEYGMNRFGIEQAREGLDDLFEEIRNIRELL